MEKKKIEAQKDLKKHQEKSQEWREKELEEKSMAKINMGEIKVYKAINIIIECEKRGEPLRGYAQQGEKDVIRH